MEYHVIPFRGRIRERPANFAGFAQVYVQALQVAVERGCGPIENPPPTASFDIRAGARCLVAC